MKQSVFMLIMFCFFVLTACNPAKKTKADMPTEERMSNEANGFLLKGNEPFWNVEISDREIVLSRMEKDDIYYPYYAPKQGGSSKIFETSTEVNGNISQLKIIVEEKKCNDSMADISYDYKATVIKDGKTYKGCGSMK